MSRKPYDAARLIAELPRNCTCGALLQSGSSGHFHPFWCGFVVELYGAKRALGMASRGWFKRLQFAVTMRRT